ncbi:MAG TPA: OmpA family protein [Stellaceae bacterium]|nr:OmpA family protein [Stellaceae bacterium]
MRRPSLSALGALALLAACTTEPGRAYLVFFPTDETTLTPDAQGVVQDVVKAAKESHSAHVVVQGEADGSTAHDADLAYKRGALVTEALLQAGLDPARVEQQPGAPGPQEKGVMAHKVVVTLTR